MPFVSHRLAAVAAFEGLNTEALALLQERLESVAVPGGSVLVREGGAPDSLYIVVSGRFSVEIAGCAEPVAEIGAGATIGEVAFFAGGTRTATCRAIRDSVVLRLTRAQFEDISRANPAIWSTVTATLARRLAAETRKSAALRGAPSVRPRPRTIAIVPAGPLPGSTDSLHALAKGEHSADTVILDSTTAAQWGSADNDHDGTIASALNALEERFRTIVYIADAALTPWSRLAIRQADDVLLVGHPNLHTASAPVALNALEEFSFTHPGRHRLVLLHDSRRSIAGTRHWLANRAVTMHHHAVLSDARSIARLWRFVRGQARGFVACGGGAYCAAHIGLYKAFREAGTHFDIFGGSSGGAAMAAAFCEELEADEISARVHATFIEGRAMRRYTVPRYGLLDHTHFDAHMRMLYGDRRIEDLWLPFFAVALDLTHVAIEVIRSGPVWTAIRASASIPGLLPPFIDEKGRLLVDGSAAANVPIDIMHQVKAGPNVVVTFASPQSEASSVPYDALPGRRELLRTMLLPWGRRPLPAVPSAANVLVRTLMANRNHFERHLEATDTLMMPPLPAGLGALDWRPHREVADMAYRYAKEEIARGK